MATTRITVPKHIIQGVTLKWTKSLADYSAAAGWALTYYFRGSGDGADVVGTQSNADFELELTAIQSAAMSVTTYVYQGFVEKGDETYLIDSGEMIVRRSLVTVNTPYTLPSSTYQTILTKIDAMIAGSLDKNVQDYTIDNRQLKRYTFTELIALRDKYKGLAMAETLGENSSPYLGKRRFRHWKAS